MNNPIKNLFISARGTVKEINKKYSKPRIQMTPAVKFVLFALRVYLFILIGLMLYKFITLVK